MYQKTKFQKYHMAVISGPLLSFYVPYTIKLNWFAVLPWASDVISVRGLDSLQVQICSCLNFKA
jgi:hypothetical protein